MTGSFHALLSEFSPKPVAVAPHVDDHTVMKQAVQKCRDNDRIMEQFGPVGEGLVGGDNGAGLLIPVGNESEKEIALLEQPTRL
jgi:hypothetical protein